MKLKGQAAIVLREAYPGYIPLGVWNVREHMREAVNKQAEKFETMNEALTHASTRLKIPLSEWIKKSNMLKSTVRQRSLADFA